MEDSERMKAWLGFLESRLTHYDNHYNFSLSTLIIIFGVITGAVSFTFNFWWSYLIALPTIVVGIIVLIRRGDVILATIAGKRNQTTQLIVEILDGTLSDPKDVARKWMGIFRS